MAEPNRCEICNKPINPAHPGTEYYLSKRSDADRVMYKHSEGCPGG